MRCCSAAQRTTGLVAEIRNGPEAMSEENPRSITPPTVIPGLHHVTAVTGNASANVAFYTGVLGLRLVKKTVNQDDVSAYHLFYGDELGTPGTEVTFFDWPQAGPAVRGAGSISEIALGVLGGVATLEWWARWFDERGVTHRGIEEGPGGASLAFTDPEGQRLRLAALEGAIRPARPPWRGSPVPDHATITGLTAITLTLHRPGATVRVLTQVLGFRPSADAGALQFETGEPGTGARVALDAAPDAPFGGRTGTGGVHHVAFRVPDVTRLQAWQAHLTKAGLANSGLVNRFYFQSLYFREPGGILFELATDGPGFATDEDPAHLGERLSLPPFLEPNRARIEAGLRPLP
jgi:glyoxalase family protein